MATTAGNFRAHLLTRLRATGTVAIAEAFSYEIINYCQTTLNVSRGFVIGTGTFTYNAGTALYTTTASVSTACARVLSLYDTTRTIHRVRLREFSQYNKNWHATAASGTTWRMEAWAPIGDGMLAIYPVPATGGTCSAVYIKNTDLIDGSTDALEIPDQDMHLLYDLCEIIALAHLRRFAETRAKMKRLATKLGLQWQG